jgi:L-alanine-DL-glutamate epimerase-like enolase superfamily enzyme
MADESVFDHHDAIRRLIEADAVDYINIKLAKSGGLLEAKRS